MSDARDKARSTLTLLQRTNPGGLVERYPGDVPRPTVRDIICARRLVGLIQSGTDIQAELLKDSDLRCWVGTMVSNDVALRDLAALLVLEFAKA